MSCCGCPILYNSAWTDSCAYLYIHERKLKVNLFRCSNMSRVP